MLSSPTSLQSNGFKMQRVSDETLMRHYHQYLSARDAMSRERQREFENLRIYAGVDNSQIPLQMQNFLTKENRGTQYENFKHFGQLNFLKTKINGIAGSLTRNPFDATYVADEASEAPLTLALQQAYMSDRELMDWDSSANLCYIMGLNYAGDLRMYVKTEHPASPMGNIALEALPPGTFMFDPTWKTGKSWDMENHWMFSYMTAEDIKSKYKGKMDRIEIELDIMKRFGERYTQDKVDWNKDLIEKHEDRYLVVQHDYLKKEKIKRDMDPNTGIVLWEWMDEETKERVIEENDIERSDIIPIEVVDRVHYMFTFAPSLSMTVALVDEKSPFQLGRLPFHPWSSEWLNGKPLPMTDQLRDAQIDIIKRNLTITNIAESILTSGTMIDEALVGMDSQKKAEIEANMGNPKYILWTKPGATRQFPNAIQPLQNRQIPGDLFNITNMMIDMMDRLVPQPAATEGRTERSGESGILFAQKIEVAKTMQETMLQGVRQLWNDIGEAYFFLAKQLYSQGRRSFTDAKGTFRMTLNDEVVDMQTGEAKMVNDFSTLPRHRVVISEAPSGVNNRLKQMELNNALAQQYAQLAPNASMTFIEEVIKAQDMDSAMKQEALEAIGRDKDAIAAETEARIANAKFAAQQAQGAGQPPPGAERLAGPNAPPQPLPQVMGDAAVESGLGGGLGTQTPNLT